LRKEPGHLLSYSLIALQIAVEKVQAQDSDKLASLNLLDQQVNDWDSLKTLSTRTINAAQKLNEEIQGKAKKFTFEYNKLKSGESIDQSDNGGPPTKKPRKDIASTSSSSTRQSTINFPVVEPKGT
jgi:hypothetical protein